MCTLTLAWQVFEERPLVVAANRDEAYARDSSPPQARTLDSGRRVVAPRDEEAGGTWMGYNEDGVFVAITNRWVDSPEGDRSRGRLVLDALDSPSAEDAARTVERELDERHYAGFYLLLADANACLLVTDEATVTQFDPGVHVVMNVGYDDSYFVPEARPAPAERQAATGRRLLAALHPEPGEAPDEWRDRAGAALGDHAFGVCIHGGEPVPNGDDPNPDRAPEGFGTKSSALVTIDAAGGGAFWYADGPPCETPYEHVDVTL